MSFEILEEEFEVLESIYPEELTKLGEREIQITVDLESSNGGDDPLTLALRVVYLDDYPDTIPDLSIETIEGELEETEIDDLLEELKTIGEENLGIAMTFAIVSHLKDRLSSLMDTRREQHAKAEAEKERQLIEEEEARTKGTPVTDERFMAWKTKFDKEMSIVQAREEEEKIRGLSAKEREEWKRQTQRLSGRQLFERDRNLGAADDSLLEEGTVSVDISQYDRRERQLAADEEEEDQITFSDSD